MRRHQITRSLDAGTAAWLDEVADGLDTGVTSPDTVLPTLAAAGLGRTGVPRHLGGTGGDIVDAVATIAEVSSHSLAAGFILWGHRTYIEYLLQSPNVELRERLLSDLLKGQAAGASGLSNAMKFLAGLEELQVKAERNGSQLTLNGKLPWVTNLRVEGFHVAAAVAQAGGGAFVASLAHDDEGIARSSDLDLMALRSTSTAAVTITDVRIGYDRVIHPDAQTWLPQVRPAFLGLQCGMSIGLARRSLQEAGAAAGAGRSVLQEPLTDLVDRLDVLEQALRDGLRTGRFEKDAAPLFRIRISLAEIAAEAVSLELQALGGRSYLSGPGRGFARRWREAAFIPIITPSLVQLKTALAEHKRNAA
jgi:alkylation response protein AidB-like acyl-CoA dehydrogenase